MNVGLPDLNALLQPILTWALAVGLIAAVAFNAPKIIAVFLGGGAPTP